MTVTDADGRRHSIDVVAQSTYGAAHLYVAHAKEHPGLPAPTSSTVFEVVANGRLYRVQGEKLRAWIIERSGACSDHRDLFKQRPTLD